MNNIKFFHDNILLP